ncbi:DNA mismatch repair protein-like protein [Emericellopsis cladophorae]|uniref:DNA mismatch repair protein-like protein n=1 Tax=Emericellopsis cladophorae TaxID=2686198 RepID=A0A9Q0BDI3_9HYPO|nr:DNA mismatch repair protein-like protein [Emericellopsis cladophorae]KAI6780861.1 DNA mismatch repair protein-like protein [Emericellopsis cladophorae]
MFESGSLSLSGSISKAALEQAEVISQVDRKFIFVKLTLETKSRDSSSSLVMIDQHAADERCKLEELLATYFHRDAHGDLTATTEPLDPSIHFEVGHLEGELLERFRHHFRTWGIDLDVRNDGGKKYERVTQVTSLPPSILERCRLEPRLLINLIRTEAWNLAETRQAPLPPSRAPEGSTHPWAVYMSRCPRGILEMLHSRACRSAIMFNDALTIDECRDLVRRVARCAYPFQCAHGRPSMAPLLDMGTGQSAAGGILAAEQVGMDLKEWTQD